MNGLNCGEEITQDRINKFDDRSREFTHSKNQRENRVFKKMNKALGICGTIRKDPIFVSLTSQKRMALKRYSKK